MTVIHSVMKLHEVNLLSGHESPNDVQRVPNANSHPFGTCPVVWFMFALCVPTDRGPLI